jgi:hypothetical protein
MNALIKPLVLLVLVVTSKTLSAQSTDLQNPPKEELVVFTNRSVFIPLEELEVAISIIPSQEYWVSRVAYIELLDPGNQPVVQTKVELYEGKGNATLYLPSYLKSGVYTLLVYTQWQKNFGMESITQRKITLLNPFTSIPKSLFQEKKSQDSLYAELFVSKEQLVTGRTQSIAYQIKNKLGEIVPGQLRIVNNSETIMDIKSERGYGVFEFAPKEGADHSLVIIDENGKLFLTNMEESIKAISNLTSGVTDSAIRVSAKMVLNKLSFKPREKIWLTLSSDQPMNVTLIIQKNRPLEDETRNLVSHFFGAINPFFKAEWPLSKGTEHFFSVRLRKTAPQITQLIQFSPDFRGELIEGKLHSQNGDPTGNQNFFLTSIGDDYRAYQVTTNSEGAFKVSLDPRFGADQLIFSGVGNFKVETDSSFLGQYSFVESESLQLQNVDIKDWLVEKSEQVQIHSIYTDKEIETVRAKSFFDSDKQTFYLDDYVRFPTMTDHIVEYIPLVTIRKINGQREFYIRNINNRTGDINKVLVTLNGIVCSDEEILNFNPLLIERIEIYQRQFHIGSNVFHGALSFFTYPDQYISQNQFGSVSKPHVRVQNVKSIKTMEPQDLRKPDMRTQLAWEPHLSIDKVASHHTYYASDIPGTYTATIVGISGSRYVFETIEFTVTEYD